MNLFNLDEHKQDSPRLKQLQEHDVRTHHAPHMVDSPWIAAPMKLAREKSHLELKEIDPVSMEILNKMDLVFFGQTKEEVETMALAACLERKESC